MASIKNIEGLTTADINNELNNGAKFVIYQYSISILVMSFKRSSDIYFIRAGASDVTPGLLFTVISFIFGWWGIPWGPIYTIGAIFTNFSGGKNVTQEVINSISGR